MAKPQDTYNPTSEVPPTTNAPSDYINVRSNGNEFGAQVGQSFQQAGAQLEKSSDQAMSLALQRQGMINETLSVDGDNQNQINIGNINAKYKSLEGLQAVASHDKWVQELTDSRQKIRDSLPNPAAQRAYDMLSLRATGYAIKEAGEYKATQLKQAHLNSANASMNIAAQSLSDPTIATDPTRSKDAFQTVRFSAEQQLQAHGIMPEGPISRDSDGNIIFPDTPNGQDSKAEYQNFINTNIGDAKFRQYQTIALDPSVGNPVKAYQMLQQDKDIPPDTRARVVAMLSAPLKNETARNIADNVTAQVDQNYKNSLGQSSSGNMDIKASLTRQESGGKPTSPTSIDGAVGVHQITPATFAQYAKSGENIHNDTDNTAVFNRIVDDYSSKYNGDPARIAVAYFSGPGNVSPPGSLLPYNHDTKDSNGKHVSSYVTDVMSRVNTGNTGQPQKQSNGFLTKADYYRQNYADIIQQAGDLAASQPGADATSVDLAKSRTEQNINDVIKTQELNDRADYDKVLNFVTGKVAGGQSLTNLGQLENSPQEVRDAWHSMNMTNPQGAQGIERLISANSRGHQATFGSNPYQTLMRILSPDSDPDHIRSADQLANQVGPNADSPLTNTGYDALSQEIEFRDKDAGSREFANQERNFLQEAYKNANPVVATGGPSAVFNDKFQKQIPTIVNAISAARREGKSVTQIFSKEIGGKPNPDYIGNSIVYPTLEEILKEQARNTTTISSIQINKMTELAQHPEKIQSVEELQTLLKGGFIKPDPKVVADIIRNNPSLNKKYIKQQALQVPLVIE